MSKKDATNNLSNMKASKISQEKIQALNLPVFSSEDPSELFTLQEKLGKGSYGHVYKAIKKGTAVPVAIKIISINETDDGLNDVRKEIKILSECNHPNIVNYLGSYFKDDNLWVGFLKFLLFLFLFCCYKGILLLLLLLLIYYLLFFSSNYKGGIRN